MSVCMNCLDSDCLVLDHEHRIHFNGCEHDNMGSSQAWCVCGWQSLWQRWASDAVRMGNYHLYSCGVERAF